MVEADALVAGVDQRFGDGLGLQMPLDAVGQGLFRDLALVLLERGNVCVAEHREAVRTQFDALGDGVQTRLHRLQRQAVEQVEIEPADADPAQSFDRDAPSVRSSAGG